MLEFLLLVIIITNRNMNNKGSLAHGKEDVSEMEGDLFRRESVSPKPSLHLALTDGLEGTRPATRTDEVDESMASSHAKAHSAINPGRLDENNQDPGDIPMLPIGPLGGNGISESESTTGDVTFGELKSSDFFNPLYENSLPATPERGNMTPLDESISSEAPINDNFKAFEGRHVESADDMSTGENTSFDAFEASFQTTFPSSFTASDSSSFANDAFNMNDFADPFFVDSSPLENQGIEFRDTMDPLINGTRNGDTVDNDDSGTSSRMLERKGRGKSPPPPQFGIRSRSRSRSTSRSRNPKMNEEPTGSTPHHSVTPFSTSTTSKSFDESSEDNHVGTNNGTKQRSLESEPLTEIHPSQDQEHSPTLVLKRLHQRRAREKAGSSEFTNNGTSRGISLSEEIRKLDAMAGGSSSGEIPLISTKPLQTKRRSSKPQQVSSTTSTVEQRRGNLIYSKKENVDILGNLKAGHNSNSKTSQSSPVNQAKANGRNGKGRPIKDTMERRHELVPTVQS